MKRGITSAAVAGALILVLGLTGCPQPGGNGNGNNNGTNNEFTDARQAAVRSVVDQLMAAIGACAALNSLTDSRLDQGTVIFGTCPRVTAFGVGGQTTTVQLEFGNGCTAAATGAATVRGAVAVTPAIIGTGYQVRYNNLFIDDQEVSGTIDGLRVGSNDDTPQAATCNIRTANVGTFRGAVFVVLTDNGEVVLTASAVQINDDTTQYTLVLDNVSANPQDNDNFIPESGSLSFVDSSFVRISVEFSDRSPERGTVRVTVGNGSAVNFTAVDLGGI